MEIIVYMPIESSQAHDSLLVTDSNSDRFVSFHRHGACLQTPI